MCESGRNSTRQQCATCSPDCVFLGCVISHAEARRRGEIRAFRVSAQNKRLAFPGVLGDFASKCSMSEPARHPINSGMGRPRSTIGVGRPLKSLMSVLAESMPRWW